MELPLRLAAADPLREGRGGVTELRREVGLFGAVLMGLGSVVGTGVFVSIGVAAGIAGPSVVLALALAALVATANGLSSAQLAASHAVAGGTYEYGYRYLNPTLGFTAGWLFLIAKTASAATAALGFAGYALRLAGGDLSARANLPDQGSELGRLGASIDAIAAAVEQHTQALSRSEEMFRQFAEYLPEVAWVEDAATGAIEFVGPTYERVWQRPAAEVARQGSIFRSLPRVTSGSYTYSEIELFRPSFCACGSIVRMSPWLDQRRVFASAGEAASATAVAMAAARARRAFMGLPPAKVLDLLGIDRAP